jgi:CHAD domain-containing protein
VNAKPAPERGARSARRELAVRLEADLAHRESLFAAAALRVRERDDPEALHDLRVTSRRLSEAFRLWGTLLDARYAKRVRRRLRRLRREAGPIREKEATLELLRSYEKSQPAETREAVQPYVRALRREIKRGRRRMADLVSSKRVGYILEASARTRLFLRSRADKLPDPVAEARRHLASARRTSERLMNALGPSGTEEAFHDARIAIKKDRYAEECWIEAEPSRDRARLMRLQALQRGLGALRDHAVLETALEMYALELAGHGHLSQARSLRPLLEAVRRGHAEVRAAFRRLSASGQRSKDRPGRETSRAGTKAASAAGPPKLRAVHPPARTPGS